MNRLGSHPLHSSPRSRIATKSASQLNFGLLSPFLGMLYRSFSTLLPFLFQYFRTTIFLERPTSSRYVSTIGLVVVLGLHSSRMERSASPERWFTLGDPARSDDEKSPNRNFAQTAVFTYGAPRQPPLQDYAAHARPSFRPGKRPL